MVVANNNNKKQNKNNYNNNLICTQGQREWSKEISVSSLFCTRHSQINIGLTAVTRNSRRWSLWFSSLCRSPVSWMSRNYQKLLINRSKQDKNKQFTLPTFASPCPVTIFKCEYSGSSRKQTPGCEKGLHNWSWPLARMVLASGH